MGSIGSAVAAAQAETHTRQAAAVSIAAPGKPENGDAYLIDFERGLFAVADGISSRRYGDASARVCLERLRDALPASADRTAPAGSLLEDALRETNLAILEHYGGEGDDGAAGCCLSGFYLDPEKGSARLFHSGDTRAYQVRDGRSARLTRDDSRLKYRGGTGAATGEGRRSPYRRVLTRAMGVSADCLPTIEQLSLQPGDRLLVISDGILKSVGERRLLDEVMSRYRAPDEICSAIAEQVESFTRRDDATLLLFDVPPE